MTSIERLQIQGIRSYSPFEAQIIEFYKPLTVIVGQNGCGKTTIIECLKQATTGDLPPNCKNGQNFIHDPNLAVTMEVKGQIKLRFCSADGKPVVVARSFNLTQRQKKKEYKALESVLTTLDERGAKVTLSTKCSDLNKLIPQLMGVSHAILENVIFCHQEEANWCLGDDATLKKKFDEIFASARYTKAMDEIRKQKNELAANVKVLRAEAETAEAKLQAAQRLGASLELDKEESEKLRAKIDAMDLQVKTLDEQLETLQARAERMRALEAERAKLGVAQAEKRAQLDEVRANLSAQFGREMDEGDEQLQRKLDEHTATQTQRKRDEASARRQDAELASRRHALEAAQAKARDRAAQLRAEANSARLREADRDGAIAELVPELGGAAPAALLRGAPFAPAHVADFERALGAELRSREAVAADAREAERTGLAAATAEVEKASLELAAARSELGRAEAELKGLRHELSASEARVETLASELTQAAGGGGLGGASGGASVGGASLRLDQLRAQLNEEETALDALREKRASDGLGAKVAASARELAGAKLSHKALLAEIETANARTAAAQQYEAALRLKARKEEEISRALDGMRDDLASVLDGARDARRMLSDGSLARALRVARDTRAAELGRQQEAAAEAQRVVQELAGSAKARELSVRGKQREQKAAEDALRARNEPALLDPSANIDELVAAAQREVVSASSELALLDFLPQFVEIARQQLDAEHTCKLCSRAVHARERSVVEASFAAMVARSQQGEAEVKAAVEKAQARLQELTELAPTCRKLAACRAELGVLEAQRARANEERRLAKAAEEAAAAAAAAARGAHEVAARCVAAVERLGPVVDEFSAAKREVDRCNDATDTTGARSQEEVMAEVKAVSAKLEQLEAAHARLLEAAERSDAQWRATDARVRELAAEAKAAELNLERQQAEERALRKVRERVGPLEASVERLRASAAPLQAELDAAKARREEANRRLAAAEREAAEHVRALAGRAERFHSLQRQVATHGGAAADAELADALAAEEQCAAKLAAAREEGEAIARRVAEASRALTRAESEVAELKENLRVRRIREELARVDTALDDANARLERERNADGTSPQELLEPAHKRRADVMAKRAEAIGRRKATAEQIKKTEKELRSEEYKGADSAHRAKSIELATHCTVVKDLDTYYKALDRSLMKFHSKKMEDINATIRELWQRTYQGHDIDAIEIQSEHEGETATGKRIHKYRVVMRRGDAYLDMRGRCSAGQKVLASLIIRLALAETFCLNCGILALDEPTTNLDHANVESFARALNEIIQQRRSQANFQLIVITHDEPFVQLIGRAENADYFYRVFKNEQQYSVVQRQAIADF